MGKSHLWQEADGDLHEGLVYELSSRDIPVDSPGFHLLREFQDAVQPHVQLDIYASFVLSRDYSKEYLDRAEKIIRSICHEVRKKVRDVGQCANVAVALSGIFDELGIWNYIATGGLTLEYDPITGIDGSTHFPPLMTRKNKATTGHAWLVAPPFKIIDPTIKMQVYRPDEEPLIPEMVLEKNPPRTSWNILDIAEAEFIEGILEAGGVPSPRFIEQHCDPGLRMRLDKYGVHQVQGKLMRMKYLCTSPSLPDGALESMGHMIENRPVRETYEEIRFLLQQQGVI